MAVDLVTKLDLIGRQIGRRRLATRACWAFVAVAVGVAALMSFDRWLGVQHLGARVLLTGVFIAGVVILIRAWIASAPRRLTPLDVAQTLENRHPTLQSLVSSGVAFSGQDPADPAAGSADLRRAVVVRASTELNDLDLESLIPRKTLRRAASAAGVAALALTAAALFAPNSLATGLTRLVNPWGEIQWPRRHQLRFSEPPDLLPVGDDFQAVLVDLHGKLPETVEIEYRSLRNNRWEYESHNVSGAGDSVTVRRRNVQQSFEYRARGGDDRHMPWQTADVVEPPKIVDLQLFAEPPAHLGRRAGPLAEPYRSVAGSKVSVRGVADQQLQRVVLHAPSGDVLPMELDADRRTFRIAAAGWKPAVGGQAWFQLETPDGLSTRAARSVRLDVFPDQPPTVRWTEPAQDLTLLATATIPISVSADDDFAVGKVTLTVAGQGDARQTDLVNRTSPPEGDEDQSTVNHVLMLNDLNAAAGDKLTLTATATDFAGQEGATRRAMRLEIVSRSEMLRLLESRRRGLLDALSNAVDEQRTSVRSLSDGAEPVRRALFYQRRVWQSLAVGEQSAQQQMTALLTDYDRNGLADVDAAAQLSRWQDRLAIVVADQLPTIETDLENLLRREISAELLADVQQRQLAMVVLLEAALAELSQWDQLQRFERELIDVKTTQQRILKQTRTLARDSLAAAAKPSPPRDAQRRQTTDDQRDAAGRLSDLLARMHSASRKLANEHPGSAARLERAVEQARTIGVQARLRNAAEQLSNRRFARAAVDQQAAIEDLQALLADLAQAGEQELADRVEALRVAERELKRLRRSLAENSKSAEKVKEAAEPQRELLRLQRERRELGRHVENLAQRLQGLQEAASKKAARAAERLAGESESDAAAKQAQQQLREAQAELEAERRRQQTLLAREQFRRLDARLRGVVADQQAVAEEIARLEGLRDDAGQLTAAQSASVQQAARRQEMIREQVAPLAESLSELPVFVHSLQSSATAMKATEDGLLAGETGKGVQEHALLALEELRLLADALADQKRQQQAQKSQPPPPGGEGQKPGAANQQQALQLALGQLRLLRTLQARLQARTAKFETSAAQGDLQPAEISSRAVKLVGEQQRLLGIAAELER